MKIGVAITTRNRREVFNECYRNWQTLLPPNSILIVVDDASTIPCPVANTRFDTQQGIAKAKNECIRLLMEAGCTDLFLSDDDCYPTYRTWHFPYINSGEKHMSLSFQHNAKGDMYANDVFVRRKRDKFWSYNSPNGCLMYMKREVIDQVGEYDEDFGIWSFEHKEFSMRIHRAGFTPFPFIDVPNGIDYFYSLDHQGTAESSVPEHIRIESSARNSKLFREKHKDLIGQVTIDVI